MRPIVKANPQQYNESQILQESSVSISSDDRKRRRDESSIYEKLQDLETKLDDFWSQEQGWQDKNIKSEFQSQLRQIPDKYHAAISDLVKQIGEYCVFCDARMYSGLAVEHILPESEFPMLMFQWDNRLAACPACRTNKGDRPQRNTGDPGHAKSTYVWPDKYAQAPNTNRLPFTFGLHDYT